MMKIAQERETSVRLIETPLWVISGHPGSPRDVRFTLNSGHVRRNSACPPTARSGYLVAG
jgi:hypothetical protein